MTDKIKVFENKDILFCPYCDSEVSACSTFEASNTRPPAPGDFSICAYCGELSVFIENGLRKANEIEMLEVARLLQQQRNRNVN